MIEDISALNDGTTRDHAGDGAALERRAKLFRSLGDHSRLAILDALRTGDLKVGEIVDRTGLSQSNTSNHLRCLAECGLVRSERDGRFARYRLADHRVAALLDRADVLLRTVATGVEGCERYG